MQRICARYAAGTAHPVKAVIVAKRSQMPPARRNALFCCLLETIAGARLCLCLLSLVSYPLAASFEGYSHLTGRRAFNKYRLYRRRAMQDNSGRCFSFFFWNFLIFLSLLPTFPLFPFSLFA